MGVIFASLVLPSQHYHGCIELHQNLSGTHHQDRMETRQERIGAFTHDGVPPGGPAPGASWVRITSAPMWFHSCVAGRAVFGRARRRARPSKQQCLAGALKGIGRTLSLPIQGRTNEVERNGRALSAIRISLSGKRPPPRPRRRRWRSFSAKAADPALAERLTARTARAADRRAVRNVREAKKAEQEAEKAEQKSAKRRTRRAAGGARRRNCGRARQG